MASQVHPPDETGPPATAAAPFSPIENELPLRFWRGLHLVPDDKLGAVRRAVFLALLTWLQPPSRPFLRQSG